MKSTLLKKGLNKGEESFFDKYLKQKTKPIQALLTKFSKDSVVLKASIEKFEKHDAYEVELCLHLPTKNLIAKEASHAINKALDQAKDRLVIQIKKHMAHLRGIHQRPHSSVKDKEDKVQQVTNLVTEC